MLSGGLIHVTWASLNVDNFLKRVEESIAAFERFTKQVLDIYECRIQANLQLMSSTQLLCLPGSEIWTVEEFLSKAQSRSKEGTELLIANSRKVEGAVKEMLALLRNSANLPTINTFDSDETVKSKKGVRVDLYVKLISTIYTLLDIFVCNLCISFCTVCHFR